MNAISRREFIRNGSLGGLALAGTPLLDVLRDRPNQINEIGIIYGNTMGPEMKKDYKKAFQKIAEVGYKTLEFDGFHGKSRDEFKQFLKDLGLRPLIGGGSMYELQTKLESKMEENRFFEKPYMVCYWPWTDDGKNKKPDDFKKLADQLNKLGNKCKENNLRFAYHNHDVEFIPMEGQIPYDIILQNTDQALVNMEMDLYWITKGNQDPIHYFEKYPGRFEIFHVKDMDKTPERSFACVGDGIIDFKAIFSKSGLAGVKHYIVEHDKPENPVECIETSYKFLKSLRF